MAIVSCPGGTSSGGGFPAVDGGGEVSPVDVSASGSTTCDSGGRHPSLALRPGVPVSEARGVGRSEPSKTRSPSVVPAWCLLSGFDRPEVAFLVPLESATVGVGSSCTTAAGNAKSPLLPRWFGPPFSPSDALGVGSRETVVRRSKPSCEDEEPFASVGSADLRCAYKAPLRIEPEAGKVGEDGVESQSKVPCDVLKDRDSGS
jgi:hypothetical protein